MVARRQVHLLLVIPQRRLSHLPQALGRHRRRRVHLPVHARRDPGPTDISPDGKFLICDAGGYLIAVPLTGDPKSRKEVETLRDEFLNTVGRISPDGQFLAYRSDEAQPERSEVYVRSFKASAETGDGKWRLSKDGVMAMLHWRADGEEVFWRGQNLESNDLLVMSVDVTTTPAFSVGTPKLLFKLPGPLGGKLGNISRDGQRFVFAVNVSATPTTDRR